MMIVSVSYQAKRLAGGANLCAKTMTSVFRPRPSTDISRNRYSRCPEYGAMERAAQEAMLARGVDAGWIEADYGNIDELLTGQLGPVP